MKRAQDFAAVIAFSGKGCTQQCKEPTPCSQNLRVMQSADSAAINIESNALLNLNAQRSIDNDSCFYFGSAPVYAGEEPPAPCVLTVRGAFPGASPLLAHLAQRTRTLPISTN